MDQSFVVNTIRMAHAYLTSPAELTRVAGQLGYASMSAAQLAQRVSAVRAAATAGSQVATWVGQAGGGSVLAKAAGALPAVETAAGAGGVAGGAAGGAAGLSGAAIAGIVVTAIAVLAGIGAGVTIYLDNRDADEAERIAQDTEQQAQDRRDNASDAPSILADDAYLVVQVTNHPSDHVVVMGVAQHRAHEEGRDVIKVCEFTNGGRCLGDIVDTPNGAVEVTEDSPDAQLSVLAEADTAEEAGEQLCSMVSDIRANTLAAGWSASMGGATVSLDGGVTAPCS